MTASITMNRAARSLAIIAVFTILGPIVVAATLIAIGLLIGVPLLLLSLLVFDFASSWRWLTSVVYEVAIILVVGTLAPAAIAGIAFAIASVYFHANALWLALLIGVLAAIGLVAVGLAVKSSGASMMLVPHIEDASHALSVAVFLAIAAAFAAGACWRVTRKLHGGPL
jgi:hypothetical protein